MPLVFKLNFSFWIWILALLHPTVELSYNRPNLSANPRWNSNATTFANVTIVGNYPYDIFVDTNNSVYVGETFLARIQVWSQGSTVPLRNITGGLNETYGLFVTTNGDVYADNGLQGQVCKWTANSTTSVSVMSVAGTCYSLFVDRNNSIYCSLSFSHIVIRRMANNAVNTTQVIAGTGVGATTPNTLYFPFGIYVDENFSLYVADSVNDRIQLFTQGNLNATTLAGNGSNETITLNKPSGVTLDANGYLFIADTHNNRIVGSGPEGFRCIVGCSRISGSATDQLNLPWSLRFDTSGNIFVSDLYNHRIQKFSLITNSGGSTTANSMQTTEKSQESTIKDTTKMSSTGIATTVDQTARPTSVQKQSSTSTMIMPMTTSKIVNVNQTCFAPVITLIPDISSLTSPIQFRRNQDVYISSSIELFCHHSLSTITQWTISNCTSHCTFQIPLNRKFITTSNELFIPAGTLNYGTYELKINVTMTASRHLTSSASIYVKIIPSDITANLIRLGTSMITHDFKEDLILDPGTYSINPDQPVFNTNDWSYEYYCRIYGLSDFPQHQGSLLTIDDPRVNHTNSSCFANRSDNGTPWQYIGPSAAPTSSLKLIAESLASNRTYQLMLLMKNHQNTSLQITSYLLVQVTDTNSPVILIGCVISTMCISQLEYQLINPTTQIALFSLCMENCSSTRNITWLIYQGLKNLSSNIMVWTVFNQYRNIDSIFGMNTNNFTVSKQLFLDNPQIQYWRFQVIYSMSASIGSSALDFMINSSPRNGSCSINPLNGSTITLFTISCQDWFDDNGIKDYSFYVWTTDRSKSAMIAFTSLPTTNLYLPAGNEKSSLLNIIVHIRDNHDCVTEYDLTSINIILDPTPITTLMNSLQNSSDDIYTNPFIRLLASENQNIVAQIIISFSRQLNIDHLNIENVSLVNTFVTPLGNPAFQQRSNMTDLTDYIKQLNRYAFLRDFLIKFTDNLTIAGLNSIKLQSSLLVQVTDATNQLTRTTLSIAWRKCTQLAQVLHSIASSIRYEDVQIVTMQVMQSISNILSAVNGPLQHRTAVLDLDFSRPNTFPEDYDTDLELDWANPNLFASGNDFSWKTIEINRNIYYQKQLANQILSQTKEILSFLTGALNRHLNLGQMMIINTSEVFMSLEKMSIDSLVNKQFDPVENTRIRLPADLNLENHSIILLRSIVQPLASFGQSQSYANLSRSISLSILDQHGSEIPIPTNLSQPMEIIIPRDPNLIIPSMVSQNVTSISFIQLFHLHYIGLDNTQSISVHFEIHPLNHTLAYLFIYRFDSSIHQIDGWTLFCPSNLDNESLYTYFLDNLQTAGHQVIIFGLRELNSTESEVFCSNTSIFNPPITDKLANFTSNYELRVYTSACYYLDANNQWKSDGLRVGPLTNRRQTHCFSTHLTTFTSAFLALPVPTTWNYVSIGAMQNKTIYLTVILVCITSIILTVQDRRTRCTDVIRMF